MEYTKEQIKAAYALNLCTVSVSQIIDYNDINIMEQEYEAILNNLNLEQMPKDAALLKVLKQILDTITYFRIEEGDKKLIEKDYQQRMKNAIWNAVPNIGMIVTGGNILTTAISLASQVGIGYMNYRRVKAEAQTDKEKQMWRLERTAIEQFNGLRRELFDTAWQLSGTYNFSDALRLTERQIHQYDTILMDNDLIRKYERLNTIKENFLAYPPFWYHFGNTANAIARSELPLTPATRKNYCELAKDHFIQYRSSNQEGLLREDPISASCALELYDLLDPAKDRTLMLELLQEAVKYSGGANDILQLVALSYLKLGKQGKAVRYLKQLVNEQYNTVMNAQLLSYMYVSHYLSGHEDEAMANYDILRAQVGEIYLYPLPESKSVYPEELEKRFLNTQSKVLVEKFHQVIDLHIDKYGSLFGRIIPSHTDEPYDDQYYFPSPEAIKFRKNEMRELFENKRRLQEYLAYFSSIDFPSRILDVLNEMFRSICLLDFLSEAKLDSLAACIDKAVKAHAKDVYTLQVAAEEGTFDYSDMRHLLDMNYTNYTDSFYQKLKNEIDRHIACMQEMQDYSLAEQCLTEFCAAEGFPNPEELFGKEGKDYSPVRVRYRPRFSFSNTDFDTTQLKSPADEMLIAINAVKDNIVQNHTRYAFFAEGDPRMARYFSANPRLKRDPATRANTVAVLDQLALKNDCDYLFTIEGIIPVRNGVPRKLVAYSDVSVYFQQTTVLSIDGKLCTSDLKLYDLYKLIQELAKIAIPKR